MEELTEVKMKPDEANLGYTDNAFWYTNNYFYLNYL